MEHRPVDPTSDRPVVKQVADDLRARIRDGEFRPGQVLPAEHHLTEWFHVSRATVREALTILRGEGLIQTIPRVGIRVLPECDKTTVPVAAGAEVTARMPSEAGRREYQLPLGVPVMVVTHPTGQSRYCRPDRIMVVVGDRLRGCRCRRADSRTAGRLRVW
ncbi:GntR family transcriptional regulator [Actinomadura sp. KC06]|uniref:winged helix-turn-helix domain-containing protein n=1 Tax=Actinomadura sp. KC06 TaxID=2530369 RepID=UPI0010476295|nr:winged helix-turn-helix domain-containing protein [Actinomadura sp. KC06]TDD34966.1 GntR family transcriptional regulator [Actinomadura sp. KC06]